MTNLNENVDILTARYAQIAHSERMYRLICETSESAYIYQNFVDDTIRTISNWGYYFDFEINEASDMMNIYNFIEREYAIALRDIMSLEKTGRSEDSVVFRLFDGKTWVECNACVIYDENKKPTDKILRFTNITKLKNANDELAYMAYYDIMTGLYNRNYFVRLLGDFVRRAEVEEDYIAVLFINIDDFRKLNDSLGMVIGDEIVQTIGQFLGEFKNENIIVSHFSGASFCLAIYDPCGLRSIDAITSSIHDRLKWPFYLSNQQEITITVSIGISQYPESATTTLDLINCAEIVMCKARTMGHNSIKYFDAPILQEFLQNVSIENKLKEAVFNQNFTLKFQPQYFIEGKKLRGVEALIRWRDYDGSMISPMKFIPIAEKNGTIIPIGAWVMEESIRTYAEWRAEYDYSMVLSLNISAIQYAQTDFIDNLLEMIDRYGVKHDEIELEITESILISDFRDVSEKLIKLRDYGIRISLDDFGTGYSSLSYLKGLPITTLKIDKSFVDTVLLDENTKVITESIVYMVKKLGFETIAEGVETEEQFRYLESIGCDGIQGYYLNRPMTAEELEQHVLCYI
ncbi:MAG: bifunctional diguanylate cyclase/phosphodiesterase [Lachnospiraceae bacterium]|jgi:diguanylate cyclase (GGDEF)-like protein|nr:bifunctional diguanylate cyclase/phosphodiesterase [Lachnospiraceae bacterium]